MNGKRYTYILILITVVIVATLGIQVYWNIKNYQDTEQQVQRDLQTALDKSVEDYFTIQAKRNTLSFFSNDKSGWSSQKMEDIFAAIDITKENEDGIKMPDSMRLDGITIVKGSEMDSIEPIKNPKSTSYLNISNNVIANKKKLAEADSNKPKRFSVETLKFEDDSIKSEIKDFTNKIVFSMTTNQMNLERLDSLYNKELHQKEININYQLVYSDGDSIYSKGDSITKKNLIKSKSALFYKNASLEMIYAGQSATILRRNLTGILLSMILIASVICCLFYMLYVIRKQKQLSLIKNDLISNITHEFKTPIATASAALEGVQNFTAAGDQEKSNRYLSVGREQLLKLNLMVEKLLETATIDNERLALQKTRFLLSDMIKASVQQYQALTVKQIRLKLHSADFDFYGDEFHLENVLNNLLDNAVKYGGDMITVETLKSEKFISIKISDNGKGLKSQDARYLFDKFYRIPQGDVHTIKGYGIGLYYTKAVIEKHEGSITLELNPTTFIIRLPNE